ncbi:conserved hypothetical protein [Ricinus communis]|uniref:Uncharacterized protein n=1 Tax=Ricinus communis TaxID=3988 RepID=B9SEK1_RICCO|nr:conserved hypothetical protein [Ricinus communis]
MQEDGWARSNDTVSGTQNTSGMRTMLNGRTEESTVEASAKAGWQGRPSARR